MKKIKSYSLSEEAIEKIKEIKKEKNYKSDSDALDAIILGKETDTNRFKSLILEVLKENQLALDATNTQYKVNSVPEEVEVEEIIKDEVEEALRASMKDIFNNLN